MLRVMSRGVRAVISILAGLLLACAITVAPDWWIAGLLGLAFGLFVWFATAPRRPGDGGSAEPPWRRWTRHPR